MFPAMVHWNAISWGEFCLCFRTQKMIRSGICLIHRFVLHLSHSKSAFYMWVWVKLINRKMKVFESRSIRWVHPLMKDIINDDCCHLQPPQKIAIISTSLVLVTFSHNNFPNYEAPPYTPTRPSSNFRRRLRSRQCPPAPPCEFLWVTSGAPRNCRISPAESRIY
jgi:hypothetical protein